MRTRILPEAPDDVRRGCHLQGNESNVTLEPNSETRSEAAEGTIDRAPCHQLDLLGDAVRTLFERIDVGYYAGNAAEITSLELNRAVGVRAAFEVPGIADPFAVVWATAKATYA